MQVSSDAYSRNNENVLDWEGNMVEPKHRVQVLVEELPNFDDETPNLLQISTAESGRIDEIFGNIGMAGAVSTEDRELPPCAAWVQAKLSDVSKIYDSTMLAEALEQRCHIGSYAASIGSTAVGPPSKYLFGNINESDDGLITDDDIRMLKDYVEEFLVSNVTATRACLLNT